MLVSRPASVIWQLAGVRLIDGTTETLDAEVFGGIGFAAMPASGGVAEAIVLNVGSANAPAVVAARDEKTRSEVSPSLSAGETVMFAAGSNGSVVYCRDGTVEIRLPDGSAVSLALRSDVEALSDAFDEHTHVAPSGGGTTSVPTPLSPSVVGTSVLLGA